MPAKSDEMTVKVKLPILNQSFTLRRGINAWGLQRAMDAEDPAAATRLMLDIVVEDERRDFDHAFRGLANVTAENVMEVFMAMFKAVSDERPTTPSRASSRTTAKKAAS